MLKATLISLGLIAFASNSFAASASQPLDQCIAAIQKQKPGKLIKLEMLQVGKASVYELEVKDSAGGEWEFMCDAKSGKITEQESEVTKADDEAFKKNMKVTEADAIATALKAHPGKVQEVEYEIEANGDASYEIDIMSESKQQTKVEVDAASGKIIETALEVWEIGEEPEQTR